MIERDTVPEKISEYIFRVESRNLQTIDVSCERSTPY